MCVTGQDMFGPWWIGESGLPVPSVGWGSGLLSFFGSGPLVNEVIFIGRVKTSASDSVVPSETVAFTDVGLLVSSVGNNGPRGTFPWGGGGFWRPHSVLSQHRASPQMNPTSHAGDVSRPREWHWSQR